MDLKSVLNEDASNARRATKAPPQTSPIPPSPAPGYFAQQHPSQIAPPSHPPHPGPPTPQSQYPPQHDFRPPSSAGPAASHLQYSPGHTPSRSFAGNQYPFPQHLPPSPAHAPHAASYGSRDSYSSIPPPSGRSFTNHQSPVLHSPSGPPLSANSVQPPSLHRSLSRPSPTPTPNSLRDPTPHSVRESPMSSHSSSHTYHQHHPSQPNTPLGPPSLYQRPSTHGFRDPISPHTIHQRTHSGASYAGSSMHSASPPMRSIAGPTADSPQAHTRQSSERVGQLHMEQVDRERSISVSPKTRLPSHSQILDQRRNSSYDQWGGQAQQSHHEHYRDGARSASEATQPLATPGVPLGSQTSSSGDTRSAQNSLSHLNAPIHGNQVPSLSPAENGEPNVPQPDKAYYDQPAPPEESFKAHRPEMGVQSSALSMPRQSSDAENMISRSSITPTESVGPVRSTNEPNGHILSPEDRQTTSAPTQYESVRGIEGQVHAGIKRQPSSTADHLQPSQKRVRYNEPPIWARRSKVSVQIRGQRPTQGVKQERANMRFHSRSVTPMVTKSPANGDMNGARGPAAGPDFEETNDGPLGYWERCITNVEPYNDVTRIVTDFIYSELDRRPDIAVNDVGKNVSPYGQIEIEAKLGTLVDRRTNERLRLPVVSTVILDLEARNHVAFESFMTEQQHKTLNDFLNAEAAKSHVRPPPGQRPRVKINYEHKRERDSFHELTQAGFQSLPSASREIISSQNSQRRTKVRITKEQKTGREIARIVKCRLVDLDIFCPREAFDIRISINLEAAFEGEIEDSAKAKAPDRVKDRLSYLHQAYQIDLTQVTGGAGSGEKLHELEVEVSSAEVRKQMRLLQEGKENELERLIKVFLDNVKVLSRAVPPMG